MASVFLGVKSARTTGWASIVSLQLQMIQLVSLQFFNLGIQNSWHPRSCTQITLRNISIGHSYDQSVRHIVEKVPVVDVAGGMGIVDYPLVWNEESIFGMTSEFRSSVLKNRPPGSD